jgi:multidrug transporter EmrE-like cation transporter
MGALYLAVSILFNTVANGFFKQASAIGGLGQRKIILFAAGLFVGLLNTLAYLKALETIKLGTAYPLFAAGSIVLIAAMSFLLFGEPLNWRQTAGLGVICAGLYLLWSA